jgi:hypothetical protein
MVTLDAIRSCLEGVIPATVATCSADGVPNATYVSQMQYVDARHVALSFQFFSKTRENILANPQATALVIEPLTGEVYRMDLLYLRTETAGALFQSMKAKLAGIASHTGMAGCSSCSVQMCTGCSRSGACPGARWSGRRHRATCSMR